MSAPLCLPAPLRCDVGSVAGETFLPGTYNPAGMRTSKGIDVPIDLADALREKPEALEGFEAMRPTSQKDFVASIEAAQGPATRQQLVERAVRQAVRHHELRPRTGVRLH